MGWLGSLGSAVGSLFGSATGRKLVGGEGHKGMAFGSVGKGKEDVSPANRKKWRQLIGDEAAGFVYEGELLFVHSSNVLAGQYFIESGKLMLEFLNGAAYLYSQVSVDEAIAFANAHSKGSWVCDTLRIRGTAHGHKKPFTRIK